MDQLVAGPALRWVRAAVLAAVAVVTGSLFHAAANGTLPEAAGLLLLWSAGTVLAGPLVGRELTTRALLLLLASWQAGTHAALGLMSGHAAAGHAPAASPAGGVPAAHPSPLHSASPLPSTHPAVDLVASHGLMVTAHAVAATAVACWLAAGERAAWTAISLSGRTVVRLSSAATARCAGSWSLTAAVAPACASPNTGSPPRAACSESVFRVRATGRRGPPSRA